MANTGLTLGGITKLAVTLFRNSNLFLQNIDTQYDDQFAREGAKIGTSLRVRLPNDYLVRTGAATSVNNTTETSITLPVATQLGVDMSFTSVDMTMTFDDFAKRIMAPAVNALAGQVAMTIMLGVEGGISNFVANTDASGNVLTPTASTILQARAILANNSAPAGDRKFIVDPITNARAVGFLAGLFNPSAAISEQYRSGMVSNALGFDWFEEQTVIKHTTSSYSGTLSVNGASQTGTTLVVNAITGGLAAGDIITIAGVNAINRVTKATTGTLQQFVVTAAAASGATSLSIYPAIIPGQVGTYVPASGVNGTQYQTVDVSPANGAVITPVTKAGAVYRKNFVFVPEAVTMVTADLVIPPNVDSARENLDGISMRMVRQYAIGTDALISRLDVLFGYVWLRPEWAVAVADVI